MRGKGGEGPSHETGEGDVQYIEGAALGVRRAGVAKTQERAGLRRHKEGGLKPRNAGGEDKLGREGSWGKRVEERFELVDVR